MSSDEPEIEFDDSAYVRRIAERIKALRASVGITQHGLAKRAGIPRSTIAMIESGRQSPTLVQIGRIAKALGISGRDLSLS
jgi:transcriptional regulator with XRE-family HTH domain